MNSKFWVVGGQYTDTAFDRLVDGSARLIGPFSERELAMQAWRDLTDESRSDCYSRYSIAQEAAH